MAKHLPHNLNDLIVRQQGPCLSLYQSTHRSHPENAQDPIRFKNLVKELEHSLQGSYTAKQTEALLKPFHQLAENTDFWQHTLDGLVVLANEDDFQVYHLQRPTPDFAVVADSWHIKPLLRQTQTQDRYQVLCLTRSAATLYEGNRYGLDSVVFENPFPSTMEKALDPELVQEYNHPNPYHLGAAAAPNPAMEPMHSTRKDQTDTEIERFFRVVDKVVYDHLSNPSGLPLILVTLPEYQGVFRKLSKNHHLLAEGVSIDPGALSIAQLREKTWGVVEPLLAKRVQEAVSRFNTANGTGLAGSDLDAVLGATLDDRVDTLLVDADQRIAGRVLREQRRVELLPDFDATDAEDVLDDIAEMVLRRGGKVMVISSEYMPATTGLAATYRF